MKNQIKTILLLIFLTAFLMVIGGLIGGRQGVIVAFGFSLLMNFITYWKSDKIVLSMYKAKPVTEDQAPQLYDMVCGLAQKAQIPMPQVYIIPENVPNAFATGRNPKHAVVAVMQGLLDTMQPDEIRAVVAHEMGHIKNRDILISTIAATLAGAVMFLANMTRYGAVFGGGDRRNAGGAGVLLILVSILAPLAAIVVQMSVSRSREYQADATGAQISGTPNSLANALRKLENYSNRTESVDANPSTAHMFTVNPLAASGLKKLFSTHPPIQERISRLRNTRIQYIDDAASAVAPIQVSDLYPKPRLDEDAAPPVETYADAIEQQPLTPAEEAARAAWRRLSGK